MTQPHAENVHSENVPDLHRRQLHELITAYEDALASPGQPSRWAALGCALARAGYLVPAARHLGRVVVEDPLDHQAARALFHALGELGDVPSQRRLAYERQTLAQQQPDLVPLEPWFMNPPPQEAELASLIILCCNNLSDTHQCLESVLAHTRPPFELVLVDNGSTDDTPLYLQELQERAGPERVVLLRNETNRGFAAGCNQALAEARGRYVVFLNNDTVVTPHWLNGLIAWTLHDWPQVGLVGAVSNYAPPPQYVRPEYGTIQDLATFAARRQQAFAGQAAAVERVTGFCLLARREVLDQVGGFDERFGLGFFEDDDLCLRVRQAGFRLLVALDVFIHHHGGRTFVAQGIDCTQQLRQNLERFRQKWGDEHAARYRELAATPALTPLPASTVGPERVAGTRPRVSLCMIVKNEEANLPRCLGSAADLVDEIIVVDTGSTDRTEEVASRFGARVFRWVWVDSFAAARNESLRHATGDWIFWLDADDCLDEPNRVRLRQLFTELPHANLGYVMKCACLPDAQSGSPTVVDHVRLFPNRPELRWRYRVHEQILPALRSTGGDVRWTDVVIHHTGYQDPTLRARKLERDLRLLRLDQQAQPDEPFILFNLGAIHLELGQPGDALAALQRSLKLSHPRDSIVRKLYALIVQCQRRLGLADDALATCQAGRVPYPDDRELLFLEAGMRRERGDLSGAELCLRQLLAGPSEPHFASVDAGICGFRSRHLLALIYQDQGRLTDAAAQWQDALMEQPHFLPGLHGLAEVYLHSQSWSELEPLLQAWERRFPQSPDTVLLRARACLARKEFAQARGLAQAALAAAPQALGARIVLSHVLLQAGADPVAAEQALREVLALDPANAEARHNLHVLLSQREPATLG